MEPHTRIPAVAGQFYPQSSQELRRAVARLLDESDVEPAPDRVMTLLAPHAGYMYSGRTAGCAYRRARGKQPNRVVLLGCSHHYRFEGASIYESGTFTTPVGDFPVDYPFASELADTIDSYSWEPHVPEHSLEVHLPFLAAAVGLVPIVPVLFGSLPSPWHAEVGRVLAGMLDANDLVLISTDLSHYLPESDANAADAHSLRVLLDQDISKFTQESLEGSCSMCGAAAVAAGMAAAIAGGANEWSLLDYRTSARASGDEQRVVGYASVSMERAA